ncbi:MAG: DNA primase [Proteobacteria bacterium]|nr:DNA primase [Pseudomonadota bacterium]
MIPPEFIDELLSRTDIVEIIESRVTLKKAGKDYTGLCPFHNEKSPSFSVSQDKQFYYCFGCQASGSALKFLMEFEHMDFIPAVESLAARAGMEVPRQDSGVPEEVHEQRRGIYDILEQTSVFYREQLRSHPQRDRAVSYLKARGLTGEIARDFGLGFAPPGWDNLDKALATSNFDRDLLIASGMLIVNEQEDRSYDRFRDRIMFPIRDLRGRTIAFGGRIIGDGKPKYLNSPETPVFHKGRELYGLYEARRRTPKLTSLVVVEGYMDVVALAQHGISYSVATLGTATTGDHMERLFRLVPRVVFCFDGDSPGRSAAWKALVTVLPFLEDGRSAAFLFLPDDEDPDSLIRKDGQDAFEKRLEEAQTLDEFLFTHLEADTDPASLEGKAAMSRQAMKLIHEIPESLFKRLIIKALAERTGLDVEELMSVAKPEPRSSRERPGWEPRPASAEEIDTAGNEALAGGPRVDHQIENAISMLLIQPELALQLSPDEIDRLREDSQAGLLSTLIEIIRETDNTSPVSLLVSYHGKPEFGYLKRLAEREHLLNVAQFSDEFSAIVRGRMARRDQQMRRRALAELLARPLSALSPEERARVREFHQKRP